MSQEPSAKRRRLDPDSAPATPTRPAAPPQHLHSPQRTKDLQAKIMSMEPEDVQAMAATFVALDKSGHFSNWMEDRHAEVKAREFDQSISFAKYTLKADYVLNKKHESLTKACQYDRRVHARWDIQDMLDDIATRTQGQSSYATKKSAFETMLGIFDVILDSNTAIARDVKACDFCDEWDKKFLRIMGTFTERELKSLATDDDGAWTEKLHMTVDKAHGSGFLPKLRESLQDLLAYQEDAYESEETAPSHTESRSSSVASAAWATKAPLDRYES